MGRHNSLSRAAAFWQPLVWPSASWDCSRSPFSKKGWLDRSSAALAALARGVLPLYPNGGLAALESCFQMTIGQEDAKKATCTTAPDRELEATAGSTGLIRRDSR